MRRNVLMLVVVLLFVGLVPGVQAQLLPMLSFPLYSTQRTDATAGTTPRVTFHSEFPKSDRGYYKNGFLELPVSRYAVTNPTRWMAIDPKILGIKEKNLLGVEVALDEKSESEVYCAGGKFWIDVASTNSRGMLHCYDVAVTHKESKTDHTLLLFFHWSSRITKTDKTAVIFGTYDVSSEIDAFCYGQFGCSADEALKDPERFNLVQSYVYWPLVETLRIEGCGFDYNTKAQAYALKMQGFAPPMAKQANQPDLAIAAYQQQVAELQATIQALTDRVSRLSQPPAPAPKVIEPAIVPPAEIPAETFGWSLRLPVGRYVLSFTDVNTGLEVARKSVCGPIQQFVNATRSQYFVQLWQGEKPASKVRFLDLQRSCNLVFDQLAIKEDQ